MLTYLFTLVLSLFSSFGHAEKFEVKELAVFEINSAITPATFDYLQHQFANLPKSALILIKMNTPGGLVSTTKDIITLMGSQDKPTVVWITPEGASASSAGSIIAASAHFILMSPGTNMGAATPVGLGEDIKENDGKAKALNDLMAMVRSLSQSRGRPSTPFEEMISHAKSFTDQEALKLGIINGILSNQGAVPEKLKGKSFTIKGKDFEIEINDDVFIKNYEQTIGQNILSVLANPSTAYFLFLLGVALIYFEFQAPGGYIAGGIGIALLILAAISFQVLPLNWGALALIFIGFVLLILEIYVTSYGLLAIGGVGSFVAGSLFLFHGEGGYMSINYPILVSTLLGVGTSIGLLVWYILKEDKKIKRPADFFSPLHAEGVIMNVITDSMGHNYQVKIRGEIWNGTSEESLVQGDKVLVTEVDADHLLIKIKKSH